MRVFHAFWSAPNRLRNGGGIVFPDYELLTMMLSALTWREKNGSIRMVTDDAGAAFFACAGLDALWDGGLDASLDALPPSLDARLFWAAGKLEALRRTEAPCVMLDTDLILWNCVDAFCTDGVTVAHREALAPEVYPDPRTAFLLEEGYVFPPEWDFSLPAANTAFLYLPDNALKRYYTDEAFRFMSALRSPDADPTVAMCFAEQRILPMCAAAKGYAVRSLLDERALDEQSLATHLWGEKRALAASPERRVAYCLGCVTRILHDFPAWTNVLAQNEQTRRYLESSR